MNYKFPGVGCGCMNVAGARADNSATPVHPGPFITHRAKSGQPTATARSTLAVYAGIERIISCKAWLDARLFLLQRYDRVPSVSGGHLPLQRPHPDKATAIKLNQQS
jgi:hypothetical protein